jgi:hypothetical protein
MAWIALIIALSLFFIGISGQFRGIRKDVPPGTDDHRPLKWIFTVGSIVAGLWALSLFAVALLHYRYTGHWS